MAPTAVPPQPPRTTWANGLTLLTDVELDGRGNALLEKGRRHDGIGQPQLCAAVVAFAAPAIRYLV